MTSRILCALLSFLVASVLGCSSGSPTANNKAALTPKPAPTIDTEVEALAKKDRDERTKAIDVYLTTNHPGWKLGGIELAADGCSFGTPCDLHLVKGSANKVVSVVVKTFDRPDGTRYTIAFDARTIDISMEKIEEIKDATREDFRANLDLDDCEQVIEANEDIILARILEQIDYGDRGEQSGGLHNPRH